MNLPSLVCKEIMYNKGSHFYALETIKSTLIPPPNGDGGPKMAKIVNQRGVCNPHLDLLLGSMLILTCNTLTENQIYLPLNVFVSYRYFRKRMAEERLRWLLLSTRAMLRSVDSC